jgi:hypothetical protein
MPKCEKCSEELDTDCKGNLRCEYCDPPCPHCDDGGVYSPDEDEDV